MKKSQPRLPLRSVESIRSTVGQTKVMPSVHYAQTCPRLLRSIQQEGRESQMRKPSQSIKPMSSATRARAVIRTMTVAADAV